MSGSLFLQYWIKRNLVSNNQTTNDMERTNAMQQGTMALPVERKAVVQEHDETTEERHPNFIESNTQAITLEDLTDKNIIPTFSDNSLTISHQNFIGAVTKVANNVFGELTPVECRVSHPIIGRVPSAQHKKAFELLESEKTIFYQRMAFVCHVLNLSREINGQMVNLCIGGVRAYNEDKLYSRRSPMKFKVFVGWQVKVCSNLMLTCDGNSGSDIGTLQRLQCTKRRNTATVGKLA